MLLEHLFSVKKIVISFLTCSVRIKVSSNRSKAHEYPGYFVPVLGDFKGRNN